MQAQVFEGGFSEAPVQSARAFRAAMNAMARPGQIETIEGALPPTPMSVAAGVLILTLCDADTVVCLRGAYDTPDVRDWITFHTGAPFGGAEVADFVIGDWVGVQPLSAYRIGTSEYPDRSATLIVETEDLAADGATLQGPGIKDVAKLSLPDVGAFQKNAMLFPLGVDFFFTAGARLAALPRTTRVG